MSPRAEFDPSIRVGPRVAGVAWGQTTRHGGRSAAPYDAFNLAPHVGEEPGVTAENWRVLGERLGFGRGALATCDQVHGSAIRLIGAGGHLNVAADALVSVAPGIGVGVYTADCVPVLYAVPGRAVAAAHCGWRGAAAGLAGATLQVLAKAACVNPWEVRVWLGPTIAQCSYEVGPELLDIFDREHLRERNGGRYELDVAGAVVADLLDAGAVAEKISRSPVDTYTNGSCYSYRRDGARTGRMLSYVRLE